MVSSHATRLLSTGSSGECCWLLKIFVKPLYAMEGRMHFSKTVCAHRALETQDLITTNLHDHITPNMWPPNLPNLSPFDYFMRGVVDHLINIPAIWLISWKASLPDWCPVLIQTTWYIYVNKPVPTLKSSLQLKEVAWIKYTI